MILTEHARDEIMKTVDNALRTIAVIVDRIQTHDDERYESGLKDDLACY